MGGFTQPEDFERRRQNLLESIQAFETVLLLDPDHAEAKLFLATCLLDLTIDRVEEARNYYREVIAKAPREKYRHLAQLGLAYSYIFRDFRSSQQDEPAKAVELFRAYAQGATNAVYRGPYEQGLNLALSMIKPSDSANQTSTLTRFEQELAKRLEGFLKTAQKNGSVPAQGEFNILRNALSADETAGGKELIDLIHHLQSSFPDLAPYILARTVRYAKSTNAPVVLELRKSLATAGSDPLRVFCPQSYFNEIFDEPWNWANDHQEHGLLVQIGDTRLKAITAKCAPDLSDEQRVKLAYAHVALQQWKEALGHFEFFGRRVIDMSGSGPWGHFHDPFLPLHAVQVCRARLGLPSRSYPGTFEPGGALIGFDHPFVFLPDNNLVWVATENEIGCFDASAGKVWKVRVPLTTNAPFTCLAQSAQMVWAGNGGGGLVALKKADRSIRLFTEKDGLLANAVSALTFQSDRLWIGHARGRSGGLGWLDVNTGQFRSLTPPLPDSWDPTQTGKYGRAEDPLDGPPRGPVAALALGAADELWLAVRAKGIQRFRIKENRWTTYASSDGENDLACAVAAPGIVCSGSARRFGSQDRVAGLTLIVGPDSAPTYMRDADGLPHNAVTSLALDGETLWVGGRGFIALLDLKNRKVLKTCLVTARSVDGLIVNGDYVWAQFNREIYRFPRSLAKHDK